MRFESLGQDLRYAVRGLRQSPGFTLAVVLTLALGLGANAAMFGIVDRLLFRAPAFLQAPDRVHRVYLLRTFRGEEDPAGWFQYTRYTDLTKWTTAFDATAAIGQFDMAVGVGDQAAEMPVAAISASYWSFFEVRPALGRLFSPAEDVPPGGAAVAVLSYPLWQSRYGGRDDVIGRQVKIAQVDYTIVGVLPRGFAGTSVERAPVAWIPISTYAQAEFAGNRDPHNWYTKYNISWIQMLARRKPTVSNATADADLSAAFRRSYQAHRELSPGLQPIEIAKPRALAAPLQAARGPQATQVSQVARWVSGVALAVLLIAAANVANLLLARALRRRREVAVRLALGVTRGRLVSQLLTESLLLAGLGGLAGLLVAQWGGAVLRAQFLPGAGQVPVLGDGRTLLFAALAVALVGLLTGLAPALQRAGDLTAALKTGSREGTYHRSRTRVALLVFQGALSVLLLVGAGLFVRSMHNVRALDLGFDLDPLLWVSVEERGEPLTPAERHALRERLLAEAQAQPGVTRAARARTVPFWMTWNEDIYVAGIDSTSRLGQFPIQAASPGYLETVGTRLLRGRALEPADGRDAAPVAVVSEAMAAALWPGRDALGQCFRKGSDSTPCITVVGIARNVRTQSLGDEDKMLSYYLPLEQVESRAEGGLSVRVRGGTAAQIEPLRQALQRLMPGASYVTVRPMSEIFEPMIRSWRLGATMFVAFGGLALVLAAIGLYSVIAYNVTQRTHELGVRLAFGAQARDVIRLILREGFVLTLLGVGLGAGAALLAGRWVAPLLYQVKPADPLVFAGVAAALLLAAGLASLLPALRAARVDPNVALRSD